MAAVGAFEQLHPSVQHHVVNSLGWRALRPFQEDVIPFVLAGQNLVIIAPTAGGKTEAAMLPVLSRMLTADWRGLSVVYVCPIKALLNNLADRLERYCTLLGRTLAVWHGDIPQSTRTQILHTPPDVLLTTPESLELLLVSTKADPAGFFAGVQVVVVDELHAFAGDDRGWHLLSVLERITRFAGRRFQRIGLSATVGNPDAMLQWLTCGRTDHGHVYVPTAITAQAAEAVVDYVGSVANAAVVISRLHRGEKRLVFVDSRARAEELGSELQRLEVRTFVTHSSLSRDERRRAEEAFASGEDCAIVATSVLELGVDVGDLDRVIQLDAPSSVSAFLQRMGRTGRRAGAQRNCLFLATDDVALLKAAALVSLWRQGFVEGVVPPTQPHHVLLQQILALVYQLHGLAPADWQPWIGAVPAFETAAAEAIMDHLVAAKVLCANDGLLLLDTAGERRFRGESFTDLLSVVSAEPLLTVLAGNRELGRIHPLALVGMKRQPPVILLGARPWRIVQVEWKQGIAYAEPTSDPGKARWAGDPVPLSPGLCAEIRAMLRAGASVEGLSRRAISRLVELQGELSGLNDNGTTILAKEGRYEWWTFAGLRVNATLAALLEVTSGIGSRADNLWLHFPRDVDLRELEHLAARLADPATASRLLATFDPQFGSIRFSELLPPTLYQSMQAQRVFDLVGARAILERPVRVVDAS